MVTMLLPHNQKRNQPRQKAWSSSVIMRPKTLIKSPKVADNSATVCGTNSRRQQEQQHMTKAHNH